MISKSVRVIHYINQFFGGIGGEDMAGVGVSFRDGPVGPGLALKAALGDQAEVIGTIICGDNYCSQRQTEALAEVVRLVKEHKADVLVAGPAFNAGRYGIACGAICEAVQERLGVKAFTALYPENPAVEQYRRSVLIVPADASALGMRKAMKQLANLMGKVLGGEELGPAKEEGYIPHGIRKIEVAGKPAADRAVELLLAKVTGATYETEVPLATYEQITPAPPVEYLSTARIALVTEGGLVPLGNPDRIRHVWAKNWASYSLDGVNEFEAGSYEGVHGGFDRTWVNEDPDRLLPLDIVRELEKEGYIGEVLNEYFVTVGNGTPVKSCQQFGGEIAQRLLQENVQAALVSGT
jgi:glycine reductase